MPKAPQPPTPPPAHAPVVVARDSRLCVWRPTVANLLPIVCCPAQDRGDGGVQPWCTSAPSSARTTPERVGEGALSVSVAMRGPRWWPGRSHRDVGGYRGVAVICGNAPRLSSGPSRPQYGVRLVRGCDVRSHRRERGAPVVEAGPCCLRPAELWRASTTDAAASCRSRSRTASLTCTLRACRRRRSRSCSRSEGSLAPTVRSKARHHGASSPP